MTQSAQPPRRVLTWTQISPTDWLSTPGLYRVQLEKVATADVYFIWRVRHTNNLSAGRGHWDSLLTAKDDLDAAKAWAQEHLDGRAGS
jgi:hypothetical protein